MQAVHLHALIKQTFVPKVNRMKATISHKNQIIRRRVSNAANDKQTKKQNNK